MNRPAARFSALLTASLVLLVSIGNALARAGDGPPTFLLVSSVARAGPQPVDRRDSLDPGFANALATLAGVKLAPSFVDVNAVRAAGLREAVAPAVRVDCATRHARGIVLVYGTLGTVGRSDADAGVTAVALTTIMTSCAGTEPRPIFANSLTFFRPRSRATPTDAEIERAYHRAQADVLRTLARSVAADPARLQHLRRLGLALGAGERSTLVGFVAGSGARWKQLGLRSANDGWVVADIDPRGTAARAGVRAGDTFVRVNGRVPGIANVTELPHAADAHGRWTIVYAPPAGPLRTVSYEAHDAAWYAHQH